jgi:hypothetical protein
MLKFGTAGLSADTSGLSINGGTTATRSGNTGALSTAAINFGLGSVASEMWDGPQAEHVFIAGDVSQSTVDKLEGYLAWKWRLESNLPANHPYKNSPPTV